MALSGIDWQRLAVLRNEIAYLERSNLSPKEQKNVRKYIESVVSDLEMRKEQRT